MSAGQRLRRAIRGCARTCVWLMACLCWCGAALAEDPVAGGSSELTQWDAPYRKVVEASWTTQYLMTSIPLTVFGMDWDLDPWRFGQVPEKVRAATERYEDLAARIERGNSVSQRELQKYLETVDEAMAALNYHLAIWSELHRVARAEYLWRELKRVNGIELLRDPNIIDGEHKLLKALQEQRLDDALGVARLLQAMYLGERDLAAARASEALRDATGNYPMIPRRTPCGAPVTELSDDETPKRVRRDLEFEKFPALAERYQESGVVMLRVHVSDTGCVLDTAILISSGSPVLDNRALDRIEESSYHPAQDRGRAIESYTLARFNFRLND